jgi:hypothetical protein
MVVRSFLGKGSVARHCVLLDQLIALLREAAVLIGKGKTLAKADAGYVSTSW